MAVELPSSQSLEDCNNNNKHEEASSLSISLNRSKQHTDTWSCFGSSDDSWSVLSSPVESELDSTVETDESQESKEDDDYMAELSRRMALHMLQEDDHNNNNEKVSDYYSPWGSSANSQPLSIFWPPLGSTTTKKSPKLQSKQALINDQIRSIQYYKLNLKQHQPMKPQYQNKRRANVITDPPQSSTSKTKSCGGTGVFLPQGNGRASYDSHSKKQGCSTVLIPPNVVQALKQHFDKVGVTSRLVNGNFPLQNGGLMGLKNNSSSFNSQQQWPAPASNHPEIALPQEWTY